MDEAALLVLLEKLKAKDMSITPDNLVVKLVTLIDEHTQQQQRITMLESVTRSLRGIVQEMSKLI